jgi:APA family basic amino acid/polyamine antiporter
VPLVPLIPILGVLVCGFMVFGLGWENWSRLIIWLIIGFDVYLLYSLNNSHLAQADTSHKKTRIVSLLGLGLAAMLMIMTLIHYAAALKEIFSSFDKNEMFFYFIFIFSMLHVLFYLIKYFRSK